jgi:hypothetical protein
MRENHAPMRENHAWPAWFRPVYAQNGAKPAKIMHGTKYA